MAMSYIQNSAFASLRSDNLETRRQTVFKCICPRPVGLESGMVRRARRFPTYAALRQVGLNGVAELVAELIERCCRHAHSLVTRIGQLT